MHMIFVFYLHQTVLLFNKCIIYYVFNFMRVPICFKVSYSLAVVGKIPIKAKVSYTLVAVGGKGG